MLCLTVGAMTLQTVASGSGPVFLSELLCDGSERGLLECSAALLHSCEHSQDVGIRCLGILIHSGSRINFKLFCHRSG